MESPRLMSIMSLADSHNKSIYEVMTTYPAWEIPYWQVYQSKNANKCGSSSEHILAQILILIEKKLTDNKSKTKISDVMLSKRWNRDLLKNISELSPIDELSNEMMSN